MLQSLPIQDQSSKHEEGWNIIAPQPMLKNPFSVMLLDVATLDEVVEKMSPKLTKTSSDQGRKPHPGLSGEREGVRWRRDVLRNREIDSDNPCEEDDYVRAGQKEDLRPDCDKKKISTYRPKRGSLLRLSEAGRTREKLEVSEDAFLTRLWIATVVQCLIAKENDYQGRHYIKPGTDTIVSSPSHNRDEPGCSKSTKIGTTNKENRPYVDLSSTFLRYVSICACTGQSVYVTNVEVEKIMNNGQAQHLWCGVN